MENTDREELSAYLDGELDPPASQRVEQRLKDDPAYRQALSVYQRSWDMLDRLDRSTVGENFTRSTLEMVSLAAAEERPESWSLRGPGLRLLGLGALAALAATVLGFVGGRVIWPDPNRQLIRDLPILENFDLYERGGSIEFLSKLAETGLFREEPGQAKAVPALAVPESLTERQAEIGRMTAVEKEHLARKLDRFTAFSLHEQRRLRELYDSLNRDARGIQLREVLVRYHEWLDTLVSSVREELDDEPDDGQRIARISQLKHEQAVRRERELQQGPNRQDLTVTLAWLDDFVWSYHDTLMTTLSEQRQAYIGRLAEKPQHRAFLWMWLMQHRAPARHRVIQIQPTEADLNRLAERVSPDARAELDKTRGYPERMKLVLRWSQIAVRHQFEADGLRQLLPVVEKSELRRFTSEELSRAQRDALPSEPMKKYRELLALYFLPKGLLDELSPDDIAAGFPGGFRLPGGEGERPRNEPGRQAGHGEQKNPPAP